MAKKRFEAIFRQRLSTLVAKGGGDGKLSANKFAKELRLTSSRRVSDWLEGGKRMPSADNLRRISEAYGVSVDWLLGFDVPKMRGTTSDQVDFELELALQVEHALAAHARHRPYALPLATEIVDGREVMKDVVSAQIQKIEDAWAQASAYTQSGIDLLVEGTELRGSKRKTYPVMEHLAFQAAIFSAALHRSSPAMRSASKAPQRKGNRPLLTLLRDISPISLLKEKGRKKPR